MSLQIPAGGLALSIGADGQPQMQQVSLRVRLDLWPTWLEIGCVQADRAMLAGVRLHPDLSDSEKYDILTEELQGGLVAMTAFAFAFDGFYDLIRQELGAHPDQAAWRKNRTARDRQLVETLRYHLKFGPKFTKQVQAIMKELFKFRSRAVHPSSAYVEPNYRPQIDSGVHPHLITFSGPHCVQCRALSLTLLGRFVDRAAELAKPGADMGWLDRGKDDLARLSTSYRIPGDDKLAFETSAPPAP